MAKSKRRIRENDSKARKRLGNKQRDPKPGKEENKRDLTFKLDAWQEEVIKTKCEQNLAIRAGRQVGKSTIISMLAGDYAANNKGKSIMIISATERQAYLLFSKVLLYLDNNYRSWIKKGKDRPTKTEIKLNNKSVIRCLPTGLDGLGIRGYTTDLLIADEAAFIPESVWPAVIPMLATTGGKIILLSTPFGDKGFFYETYTKDDSFKTWHINAEEVAKKRQEPQRTFMLDHQEKQKAKMTRLQYAQEYLGEFVSELQRLFNDDIIKSACILRRQELINRRNRHFLGVDIARMGEDAGTYEIIERTNNSKMYHVENIVTRKKYTTETFDKIVSLNKIWNFKQIGIDAGSGSLGVGILDFLLREPGIKRKVIALNNLSRSLDHTGERRRQLLKEDMYMNLLALLEKDILKLLNDDSVIASLRSVQYEYLITPGKKTTIRIFGNDTHIAEGLIRAAWLANSKQLNTFITYI